MSTKRLTDAEFAEERHHRDNSNSTLIIEEAEERLDTDHLQAREDVKRLAEMLRCIATFGTSAGARCWCSPTKGACWTDPAPMCKQARALLSEVEAVRQ